VNLIDCRESRRDLKRGAPSFRPFRVPDSEANRLRYAVFASANPCCSTTEDTSNSHARSGVGFEMVNAWDNAASVAV
jgi:hypothetical protein